MLVVQRNRAAIRAIMTLDEALLIVAVFSAGEHEVAVVLTNDFSNSN